jgi:malonate decarboxylase gamma subunit
MSDCTTAKRGRAWFEALTGSDGKLPEGPGSLMVTEATLGGEKAVFVGLAPDAKSRFPRANNAEVGLEEGFYGTKNLRQVMAADAAKSIKRPIISVVDSKCQAYGRREELVGIHIAAAAIIAAFAEARMAGHPVITLIVGRAVSGSFLTLCAQANRMIAFDDPEVLIHAMYPEAAARITKRSVAELNKLGEEIVPMAYDIKSFAKLGGLYKLLEVANPDTPTPATVEQVKGVLIEAIANARQSPRDINDRLETEGAKNFRKMSRKVREMMTEQWAAI